MLILEQPYVSPAFAEAARSLKVPILSTSMAREQLGDATVEWMGDEDFARRFVATPGARLYTNSENAIDWVARNLADTHLPGQIETCKDKVRFRELLASSDPDYRFAEVRLEDLEHFDVATLNGPFVAKPAVGFFSLGVEIVADPEQWPAAADRLRIAARRFRDLYPRSVLDLDRFVLEQMIEGEEFAIDAYFDADGAPVIINVLEHPFAHGADVSDRVYRTRPATLERWHAPFSEYLTELGARMGLRDFPIHVELRVDSDGTIRAIEANPLRFGGWCATDIAAHAWGFCPYRSFLFDERPDWDRLCDERRGKTTALIVADLPAGLDRSRIRSIDFEGFVGQFERPLELRKVLDPRHPVFAFLFVEVDDSGLDQLDAVLHDDLMRFVRMEP